MNESYPQDEYLSHIPISLDKANSRALFAAIASTSMVVKGRVVFLQERNHTIPTLYFDSNRAPLKFTLYRFLFKDCQQVGSHTTGVMVKELWRINSRNLSFVWGSSWLWGTAVYRFFESKIISSIPFHLDYNLYLVKIK